MQISCMIVESAEGLDVGQWPIAANGQFRPIPANNELWIFSISFSTGHLFDLFRPLPTRKFNGQFR